MVVEVLVDVVVSPGANVVVDVVVEVDVVVVGPEVVVVVVPLATGIFQVQLVGATVKL